jgi:acid phosphatase (class A)
VIARLGQNGIMKPSASLALSLLLAAPSALAPAAAPGGPRPGAGGYLAPAQAEGLSAALPPPPAPGSPEARADARAVSEALASPASPRWRIAQADAELDPASALSRFDCALDARLEQGKPPALTRLFTRELADAVAAWTPLKTRWLRPRPTAALGLAPCVYQDPHAPPSSSYPAGNAVVAELWGATLQALAPDRRATIQAQVRRMGESRVVCGLHYPSDIAAGVRLGERIFAAIAETPAFRADLEAGRLELEAIRARGRTNPGCVAEAEAYSVVDQAGRGAVRAP